MTGRLAFSPFGFFRFQATTHACLKLWLILPEAGQKALDLFPAMRGSTFFPRRLSVFLAKSKKDRPSSSSSAFRAVRLRARSPPAVDRHRGCDGRGLKRKTKGE